jgi:hypothetical protein
MNKRSEKVNRLNMRKRWYLILFYSMNRLKKTSKFNNIEKIHNDYKYRCIQINITYEIHFDLLDDDEDIILIFYWIIIFVWSYYKSIRL